MSKTGLTSKEYDQLFDALGKYGMHDEAIADKLSDNVFMVAASLPNTAKTHFEPTKQDEALAEKLDIEPMTVAKFTTWCQVYGIEMETQGGFLSGNNSVKDAFAQIDINQYSGQHYTVEDVAGSLSVHLDKKAEAIKEERQERIEELTEKIKESLNPSTYEDKERHLKLVADGDKITVYSTDNKWDWGNVWHGESESVIGIVDCPAEYRREFFSEFKEQIEDVDVSHLSMMGNINKLTRDIMKEIEAENTFSTGSPTIDANRDALKAEIAKLESDLENAQEKLGPFSNGFWGQCFGENIKTFINETQEKLDSYYKQLEIYEDLEVDNARAMKSSLETARERIIESINELKGNQQVENLPKETREYIERLETELDEVNDRLSAAKRKIASAGEELEKPKKELSTTEKNQSVQNLPFIIGQDEAITERKPYYPDDSNNIILLVDRIKDDASKVVEQTTPFIKGAIQKLVVGVDNAIGDLKDDFDNISTKNPNIKDFVNSVREFAENTAEKLREMVADSKNIGSEISQEINNGLDAAKEAIHNTEEAINEKTQLSLDKESIDMELFDE